MTSMRGTDILHAKAHAGNVLVCFAVPEEARHFKPGSDWPHEVIVTGIGPLNAKRSLTDKLRVTRPDLLLTCGFAGGLNPELKRGDVVFESAPGSSVAGHLTDLGARAGTFHCAEKIVVTAAGKQQLRDRVHADAVEMESGVIGSVCRQQGIPYAVIRVISDDAATDLPLDFNALSNQDGNISYARLAASLLRSPGRIPRLMRFRQELDECSRKLATVLEQLLQRLQMAD